MIKRINFIFYILIVDEKYFNFMPIWITGKVINVRHWTDRLFTIVVHAPISEFIAGQFIRIKIQINNFIIQRAYSYLNAPENSDLEFYIATVAQGKLTPYLSALVSGDTIILTKEAYGSFVLDKIPSCENLWMLATGTGIAPYLSILSCQDRRLDNFLNIVLVHATQFSKNLNYLFKMMQLKKIHNNKLHIETVLSQECSTYSLYGRIPHLISNDLLEKKVGINLDIKNSHVMLCGNPAMIYETKKILYKKYGMKRHVKGDPGHITQECYW